MQGSALGRTRHASNHGGLQPETRSLSTFRSATANLAFFLACSVYVASPLPALIITLRNGSTECTEADGRARCPAASSRSTDAPGLPGCIAGTFSRSRRIGNPHGAKYRFASSWQGYDQGPTANASAAVTRLQASENLGYHAAPLFWVKATPVVYCPSIKRAKTMQPAESECRYVGHRCVGRASCAGGVRAFWEASAIQIVLCGSYCNLARSTAAAVRPAAA